MKRRKQTTADSLREQMEKRNGTMPAPGPDDIGDAAYHEDLPPFDMPPDPADTPATLKERFGNPILCSELRRAPDRRFLLHGLLAPGGITLLSALWKCGKTTFLSRLLATLERGGDFCGLKAQAARVLVVTEENQGLWADRRDMLDLGDHVRFLIRPFTVKPAGGDWLAFIAYLVELQAESPADLIVLTPSPGIWPIRDENDAPQVQDALMPLRQLTGDDQAAVLLVHHLRKGDGQEATGTRGSGALPAFVDTILEFRRFSPADAQDRRRVLTGYGRWDETPSEIVIELAEDGNGYTAQGDRSQAERNRVRAALFPLLPSEAPGVSVHQLMEIWPKPVPRKASILDVLRYGVDVGDVTREGAGKRGNPFTFWARPP